MNPTTARLHTCHRCHAAILCAHDAPLAGLDIRLDPLPLTPITELAALLTGCATYDLVPHAGHHIIIWRDAFRIPDRQHPILATHKCPGPIPATALHKPPPKKKHPTHIPF